MKIKILLLLSLTFGASTKLSAQWRPSFEISSGLEVGFWEATLNEPFQSLPKGKLMWHQNVATLPVSLGVTFQKKKFHPGLTIKNQHVMFINQMFSNTDASMSYGSGVNFTSLMLTLGYSLVDNEKYQLIPVMGFGTFINSQRGDTFWSRRSLRFAFQNRIHMERMYFHLSPMSMSTRYLESDQVQRILNFGVEFGLGMTIQGSNNRPTPSE